MGRAIVAGGAEATKPIAGILLSDIAEGSIVKLNENGSPVEFYVAKHDYESALNGTGRTLLVRKSISTRLVWGSSNNKYASSNLDSYLNGTYKDSFGADIQMAIGTTKFYYTPGYQDITVTTLERGIFQLSLTELGKTANYARVEGSAIPIASTLTSITQGTRTPYSDDSSSYGNTRVYYVQAGGTVAYDGCTSETEARPCFTLPSASLFDKNTLLFKGVA